jgi:hypothetical protein
VVIATGYYDWPNRLGVPGEDLPKVTHYYTEAHPYADQDCLVVGGGNSAGQAVLHLAKHAARRPIDHPCAFYLLSPESDNHRMVWWLTKHGARGDLPAAFIAVQNSDVQFHSLNHFTVSIIIRMYHKLQKLQHFQLFSL